MTATNDHRISLSGTLALHVAVLVLLIILGKSCNPLGGGGGTNGLGDDGLMALDIAGFGTLEDGIGDEFHEATAESFDQPTGDSAPILTDDEGTETPLPTKPDPATPTNNNSKPNDNKPKDTTNPQNKPKENQDLNKALIGLKPSGQGKTQGKGDSGKPDGQIDKDGALGGGGSTGKNGGNGGGNNGGDGPGDGPGSGKGSGGFSPFEGPARSLTSAKPSDVASDDGIIIVKLCIDRFGNVKTAEADAANSQNLPTSSPTWFSTLSPKAVAAVKKLKFNVSQDAPTSQCGTYKITYKQS
ncbi:MAG: hypothetical protein ACKVOR_13170 [Flavobacteriales bacterium]